jgi:16S rRNA (cytidine1402-2'-O)-methyltransferase
MTNAGEENDNERSRQPLAPGLYLVATPIGNLEDITLRALRVLRTVDRIACEDTRQTQKLLNHFQIRTPTVSYHQHNEAVRAAELVRELKSGARIAVVSDAGTPGIADPGGQIAAAAIAAGIPVFPIPGANAALSALIASGLGETSGGDADASSAFTFHGFLPAKEGQRRTALEALKNNAVILSGAARERSAVEGPAGTPATVPLPRASHSKPGDDSQPIHIFYEAPHRILATLADIEAIFGPAQHVVLARELTKIHEEFLRGAVSEVRANLASRPSIKGEFVLLFAPASAQSGCPTSRRDVGAIHPAAQVSIAAEVRSLMQSENLSEMDALKRVARARGLSKSAAYREWQRGKGSGRAK